MCDYMPYYMPFLLEILHGGGGITTRGFSIEMLAYRVYVYGILNYLWLALLGGICSSECTRFLCAEHWHSMQVECVKS